MPLLLVDKPEGWTSHDVVAKLRGVLKTRRIGHAGTLDPFATGLLILGVNEGTKELTALIGLDKSYEATAILGATTDTFDKEGEVKSLPEEQLEHFKNTLTQEKIQAVLTSFLPGYEQKAPLFSAKRIQGKRLYDLARAGKATEDMRPTKDVKLYDIELLSYSWPKLTFRVHCSSGTYIRSLADDIGQKLGCGAYLTELRRTSIGMYEVEDAKKLEDIQAE